MAARPRTRRPSRDKPRNKNRAQDNRSKAKRKAQSVLSGYSRPRQLQHQQDRIDAGLELDPSLAQPPPFQDFGGDERTSTTRPRSVGLSRNPVGRELPGEATVRPIPRQFGVTPRPLETQFGSLQDEGSRWDLEGSGEPSSSPERVPRVNPKAVGRMSQDWINNRVKELGLEESKKMARDMGIPINQILEDDPVLQYWRERHNFDPEAEAMAEMGPNASYLSNVLNDPNRELPPIQPGWNPRFAGLAADREARRQEATRNAYSGLKQPTINGEQITAEGKSPEELKEDIRAAREREWADLTTARMDDGLPVEPKNGEVPMTTHPGTATSGVSALPRSLDRVEAELQDKPNYDRAAGPQNDEWREAREQREAERDERLARHQAGEARKARGRERRLEERRAAPRPRTAGGMGALWRRDPMGAAKLWSQNRANAQQAAAVRARNQLTREGQEIERDQLEAKRKVDETRIGKMEAETTMTEAAASEESRLRMRAESLRAEIRETEDPKIKRNLEDELDRVNEQRNAILARSGGGDVTVGAGDDDATSTSRPRAVGDPLTERASNTLRYELRRSDYGGRVGIDGRSPEMGTELGGLMASDAESAYYTEPSDETLDALLPALQQGASDLPRTGRLSTDELLVDSSIPKGDESDEVAKERVRAALKYLNNGSEGPGPKVNGYELVPHDPWRPWYYDYQWVRIK